MTSEERHQIRYKRRVIRRQERMLHARPGPDNYETAKRRTGGRYAFDIRKQPEYSEWKKRIADADDFDKVFSFGHLWRCVKICCRGVRWRAAVQRYLLRTPMELSSVYRRLHTGRYKTGKQHEFDICERGKPRHISAQHIRDRVVHRCACDYALVPRLCRSFIYDNGASLEGKGQQFSMNRCMTHLHQFYREYKTDGYILTFDFHKFFDTVSHDNVKRILNRTFRDQRIIKFTEDILRSHGTVGVGLGSCISQVLALASANELDHMIKEQLGIRYYGRYMDDGYLIHHSKAYLQECLERIREKCRELGITLNEKKTQIIKLSHGFTYLKARIYLLPSGQVVKKIYKRSVTRMRRKLKKLRKKVDAGIMTEESVYNSYISWRNGYAANYDAYHTIQNMDRLYCRLYAFRLPISKKEAS